jgi:hypothetical protein
MPYDDFIKAFDIRAGGLGQTYNGKIKPKGI